MSYEVLYNTCYGGFSFPEDFIKEVFRRFPPESEEGKQLWKPTTDLFIAAEDPVPTGKWTHRIVKTEEFCHGYQWIYYESITDKGVPQTYQRYIDKPSEYCTKDFRTYYYVSNSYADAWRTLPVIIAMAREFNLIGAKHRHTNLGIARVPADYDFAIDEYDGMETVCAECPTAQIVSELLQVIRVGNRDNLHPITKRLLDDPTVDVNRAIHPHVIYDDKNEH